VIEAAASAARAGASSARASLARSASDAGVHCERAGLILNRIRGEAELGKLAIPAELTLLGRVFEDQAVRDAGIDGACLLDLPDGRFLTAVRACLSRIGIPASIPPSIPPRCTG